jgi:multidrug transporter EmrE-like cation transporter
MSGYSFLALAVLCFCGLALLHKVADAGMMGAASVGGQICLLTAMETGVPGHIVFPIANGGGLFLVVLVGIFLFGERVHGYGTVGIVLRIVATILLSLH